MTKHQIMSISLGKIYEAAHYDHLDDAASAVQNAIGQTAGDVASIFFSDHNHMPDNNTAQWLTATKALRIRMLVEYLMFEWTMAGGFEKHDIVLPDEFEKKHYYFEELGVPKEFVKCVHWYDDTYWIIEWHTPPNMMTCKFWTMNDGGDYSSDDLSELEDILYKSYAE